MRGWSALDESVPPILHAPLFAVLFYGLLVALGFRLTRLLRVPLEALTPWEKGLVCAAVGGGTIQYLPLLLSAVGQLSTFSVRVCIAVLAMVLLPDCARIARRLAAVATGPRRSLPPEVMLWWSLLALFAGILLVRAAVVAVGGDDDGYHLMAARRWLEAGGLTYLPTYTHTDAPVGFEMLYLIALAISSVESAKLLHFGAGVFCLLGIGVAGLRLGGRSIALLAIALLMVPNPVYDVPFLFGMAYNDLAVCWMTITCLVIWLAYREQPAEKLLWCGAVCAGFAGSFKFTALSVGIALAFVVFTRAVSDGLKWGQSISVTVKCGVASVIPVLPWLWRNWLVTGNPLYPMLSSIIPTRDWSEEQGRVFTMFFRYYNWAKASGSRLGLPQRRELLFGVAFCAVVAFFVAIAVTRRRDLREMLVFAAVMIGMALGLTGLYFRFWLPALACLALFAGAVSVARWGERAMAWAAVFLLAAGISIRVRAESSELPGDWRMAAGLSSREQEYRSDPMWTTWTYINTNTPVDSRVLLASFYTTVGASSGAAFWVDRPTYVTDSHIQDYIRLSDWPAFLGSIRRAGIDFVVISDTQFDAGRHGFTFTAGTNEYPFCVRLVREYGTLVNQYEHWQVYRLRPLQSAQARWFPDSQQ
ncbi:MAG TPA: hypothetical protein VFI56_27840 [Vicinamibacterales bacterium]|nr:hypothetical protein [Vicinamibacterales bacterium]